MENQFQKVVNISYLALAGLIYFLFFMAMMKLSSSYDLESRMKSIEFVIRGLAILLAVAVFVGLYKNTTANTFMNEVAGELLTKVTWPTGQDTVSATIVVMITVIIAGIMLAIFDWVFTMSLQSLFTMAARWFS